MPTVCDGSVAGFWFAFLVKLMPFWRGCTHTGVHIVWGSARYWVKALRCSQLWSQVDSCVLGRFPICPSVDSLSAALVLLCVRIGSPGQVLCLLRAASQHSKPRRAVVFLGLLLSGWLACQPIVRSECNSLVGC